MRPRNLLAIAVLLAAGLAAVLFFYRRQEPPPEEVPALFHLAPSGATSLFYVDLAALRNSPFLAELLAFAPSPAEDREYREFVAATGFDYSRDLDHALIATLPSTAAASTVAIADGRFNREKITAYALRSGKLEKRNGSDVYVATKGKPLRTVAFAFLAPGRILVANSASLAPTEFAAPRELAPDQRERLRRIGGAALIALTPVDAAQENFSVFGFRSREVKHALRDVRWLSLAARPDGGLLKVVIEAECSSAAAAKELVRAAETLRLLARLSLSEARTRGQLTPQAAALANAILRDSEFLERDARVQIRFDVTAKALAAPAQSR